MSDRPLAVKIYCGVIGVLLLAAVLFVSIPALVSQRFPLSDMALMFVPMAVMLIFLWGVWRVRWWGVIGLSTVILAVEGCMVFAMPDRQGVVAIVRGALWLVPLWWIAWAHRQKFR